MQNHSTPTGTAENELRNPAAFSSLRRKGSRIWLPFRYGCSRKSEVSPPVFIWVPFCGHGNRGRIGAIFGISRLADVVESLYARTDRYVGMMIEIQDLIEKEGKEDSPGTSS